MPDNPIGGLYPQPPQQPAGVLSGNPLYAMGMLSQINANMRFQQEFNAQKAVGAAFQNALNPDGSVDQSKLVEGLHNPAAAFAAPGAIGTMLEQRGQLIRNSTAAFGLSAGQNAAVLSAISGLDRPGVTPDDIRNTVVNLARSTNIPSSIYTGWLASIDPSNPRASVQNIKNIALGATAQRVQTIDPVTGQPVTISQPAATYTGALPTELPPQLSQASKTGMDALNADQQASASRIAGLRPLQNALPLIEQMSHFEFGPGSTQFAQFKRTLQTAGVIPQDSTAADMNAIREEASKYLQQTVLSVPGADRSNEALFATARSRPGLDFTQKANLALIKNEIGQARMDAAMPSSFVRTNPDYLTNPQVTARYPTHKNDYYQNNDLRAFSFDLMSPDEQQQIIKSLGKPGSAAWKKFNHSLNLAVQSQYFSPPQ